MIDGIGGRMTCNGPSPPQPKAPGEAAGAPAREPVAGPAISRLARDLAASPPVDSGKVERLRTAIVAGTYTVDPHAIAAKMIALETPFRA